MICYRNVCGEISVKPKVYFTKTVTPEKVIEMYKQLDCKLPGNVALRYIPASSATKTSCATRLTNQPEYSRIQVKNNIWRIGI